jgi:L-2-hydroxyglutarate oxidase LhgO
MAAPRIIVIGGGIVGLATAYKLLSGGRVQVTLLEKEGEVGQHQSGHNSGVLHAGLYYKPGSSKAKMAVAGIREMVRFCDEHSVPYLRCGKLVVAVDESERPRLDALFARGTANGLTGLAQLDTSQMREIEPHVGGVAAVRVPEEGIVDYPAVCRAMGQRIIELGGALCLNSRVRSIRTVGKEIIITAGDAEHRADFLVGCAGLHADRIAEMDGLNPDVRIVPFRGEYYRLRDERQHLVQNLIYPVPDPNFPFLGVHFTRMIGGGVEAGPNAVLALSREGYRKGQVVPRDVVDTLTFPGLWRFLAKHPTSTVSELKRSYSRRLFTHALQRLVPDLREEDLAPGGAGVRAQAMSRDGKLVEDFQFSEGAHSMHVLNAPSPAATASLAIGGAIAGRVVARLFEA